MAYDARNRLTSEKNQLGAIRSFVYDAVGNRIATTDRNGRKLSFIYDALNRQTKENWLNSSGNPIWTITSNYDAASQLTSISDPKSSYNFTYDALGRQTKVNNGGTPQVPFVALDYQYDSKGNLTQVSDAISNQASGITAYSYDSNDRVTEITQAGNGVASKSVNMTYDAIGKITSLNRYSNLSGNQLVTTSDYIYDNLNRLTTLTHSNTNNQLANYGFVYDAVGRITQITDIDGVNNYNYDTTNQLTGADHTNPNNPDESYTYDANGNRLSSSVHGNGYVTGANNRYSSDGTYNYQYDAEGNLIGQTFIATGTKKEFQWDYRNRLLAVVDKNALGAETQRVEFTYDAMNNRIAKTVDITPLNGINDGVVTRFVYDRDHVLLEFVDNDGTAGVNQPVLDKRYLYGTGVDQILAQENAGGEVTWLLTDHLGTVRDLVDNSGNVVNHLQYDSYGNVVFETNPAIDTRYLFTGREFDSETGLYYYRARYYDAGVGKFISEDPIGFDGGDANLYRYVENSPVKATDPSGKAEGFIVNDRGSDASANNGGFINLTCALLFLKNPIQEILIATVEVISRPDPLVEVNYALEFSNGTRKRFRQRVAQEFRWVGSAETKKPSAHVIFYGTARGLDFIKYVAKPPGFLKANCKEKETSCENTEKFIG